LPNANVRKGFSRNASLERDQSGFAYTRDFLSVRIVLLVEGDAAGLETQRPLASARPASGTPSIWSGKLFPMKNRSLVADTDILKKPVLFECPKTGEGASTSFSQSTGRYGK
jgi:hypothetical protein